MDLVFALVAGFIQGLTEFLPISSTGHLIILEKFFGVSAEKFGLAFDASLHLGTLLAVIIFFHRQYIDALKNKDDLLLKLAIGTIPAVAFGILLENYIETSFRNINVVALSLIFFSFVIIFAEKFGNKQKNEKNLSLTGSLLVGFAQAMALIPGVSRSGATISAGLFLGQTRESAARFAFLLSGPIIAGAGSKKFIEVLMADNQFSAARLDLFLVGMISSFVFGYLTIKYFLKYLATNSLYPFIVYRILLGIALLIIPFLTS